MPKKTLVAIGLSILLFVAALIVVLTRPPSAPNFQVKNADADPVRVVARWRDNTRDLGEIGSGKTVEISVDNGAPIALEIMRSNGTAVSTGEIYLAADMPTHVEITRTGVAVKSGAE